MISLSSFFLPSCLHFPQHTGLRWYRERERGSLVEVEMVDLLPRQILAIFLFKCHPWIEGVSKVIWCMTSVTTACSCTCLLACICFTDNVWWNTLEVFKVLDINADVVITLKHMTKQCRPIHQWCCSLVVKGASHELSPLCHWAGYFKLRLLQGDFPSKVHW